MSRDLDLWLRALNHNYFYEPPRGFRRSIASRIPFSRRAQTCCLALISLAAFARLTDNLWPEPSAIKSPTKSAPFAHSTRSFMKRSVDPCGSSIKISPILKAGYTMTMKIIWCNFSRLHFTFYSVPFWLWLIEHVRWDPDNYVGFFLRRRCVVYSFDNHTYRCGISRL